MKCNLKQLILSGSPLLMVILLLMTGLSCKKSLVEKDWVDLRYRVNDAYVVTASQPQTFSFVVKSTDRWEILGNKDWYTITPNKGEAGDSYTVTVTCTENTNLDDRIDTLSIKSNYWVGKQFVLTQLGTAYLDVDGVDIIGQQGGAAHFTVQSNQRWTSKITKGELWLSVESGLSGEKDGQVVLKASPNTGELRTAVVTMYDRNGKVVKEVSYTQDGVLLNPRTPDNGKWFEVYDAAQQLLIPVVSNAEWTVSKENPTDDTWYTFQQTDFNGSGNLVLNVSRHLGSSVRSSNILLTSKATNGATPLIKTIRIKQANPQIPVVNNVNRVVAGDYYGPGGLQPGKYNFYLEPFGATQLRLFWIWGSSNPYAELRFHILNNKTDLSTTPFCNDVFSGNSNTTVNVTTTQANVLTIDIQKAIDKTDPTKSWIYTEWILNGKVVGKATSDGIADSNGSSDTWKIPFGQISAGGTFILRATGGSATLTKYEYIAPLVWGE